MNFAYKLGKLPARHDPRTLKLSAYLNAPALPTPPEAHDWTASTGVGPGMPDDFGMLGNDTIGDCAEAMAAHEIEVEAHACDKPEAPFTTNDVTGVYSAVTGYDPAKPATDHGTVLLDLLNYERTTGFCGRKIWAYVALMSGGKAPDLSHVKLACWLFGPLSAGVLLRKCDLASAPGSVWSYSSEDRNSPVAGGHAAPIVAYDADGVTLITWAARKRATWGWLIDRLDECYARLGGNFFRAGASSRSAPNGFAYADLQRDLNEIAA